MVNQRYAQIIDCYLKTDLSYTEIGAMYGKNRSQVAGIVFRHCPPGAKKRGTPGGARRLAQDITEDEIRQATAIVRRGGNQAAVKRALGVGSKKAASLAKAVYEREDDDGEAAVNQRFWGCRWIYGHVGERGWRLCQAPQAVGSSYCADHHAACHRPTAAPTKPTYGKW